MWCISVPNSRLIAAVAAARRSFPDIQQHPGPWDSLLLLLRPQRLKLLPCHGGRSARLVCTLCRSGPPFLLDVAVHEDSCLQGVLQCGWAAHPGVVCFIEDIVPRLLILIPIAMQLEAVRLQPALYKLERENRERKAGVENKRQSQMVTGGRERLC